MRQLSTRRAPRGASPLVDKEHRQRRLRTLLGAATVITVAAVAATGASGVSGDNTITRFAGIPKNAFGAFSGDGGPALRAELDTPVGVAIDRQGNLYIADRDNHRVRKVSTSGIITTFAGGGRIGHPTYGDGGPATAATIEGPWGVAVGGQGNVYISERSGQVVRKVSPSGIISTVAGTRDVVGFGGDGGAATAARMFSPQGLAVDAQGNLYIADAGNGRVRRVSPSGIISTYAGRSPRGFSGDGGPATSAQLNFPAGLALDRQGNLYLADQFNNRVRKVSAGGTITTVAGGGRTYHWGPNGGPAATALVPNPFAVAVDAQGSVYTASGRLIYKVSGGRIALLAGNPSAGLPYSGDNGPARRSRLTETWGMAVDGEGNLYFSDIWSQTVRKIWASRTATRTAVTFISPSRNISCQIYDRKRTAYVYCQSRRRPHSVRMNLAGRFTVCRGVHCLGLPGSSGAPPLSYGRQITVGRFSCRSRQAGVRCTVIRSGKGFLIDRAGVRRVGR